MVAGADPQHLARSRLLQRLVNSSLSLLRRCASVNIRRKDGLRIHHHWCRRQESNLRDYRAETRFAMHPRNGLVPQHTAAAPMMAPGISPGKLSVLSTAPAGMPQPVENRNTHQMLWFCPSFKGRCCISRQL